MTTKTLGASALALGMLAGAAGPALAIDLSFALHTSPPGPEFEAVDRFVELVEERSGGEIEVRTYPAAVLGGERDNLEQLTVNEVQMTLFGDLLANVVVPEYAPTVVPFIFPGPQEVFDYWASPVGDEAKARIREKVGVDLVAFFRRGDRQLTAKKAITTPDDIKGLKMRVPEIASWVKVWSQIGAAPTPVAWPETFGALQLGVVEGQENPCFNINQAKLYEVQSHLMTTAHVPAVWHWSISTAFLDSLTPELREAVVSSVMDAASYGDEVTEQQIDQTCNALIEEHGMERVEVDRAAFAAAARPAIDELSQAWAPGVLDAVSKYLE
ncbi:TRAP transporter substrate-binding protein [Marinivivus vitaminiproducens]|uniref:TRAP transporter substrate-binding protein n=1 Tax=Marinivivus vitaminiproducens TaxID=3035935 RepID=UPI0027A1E3AA|nr:TRAP transporter substrate-binding protein [Geminicoccaceae bacterium SCSIO 64248]